MFRIVNGHPPAGREPGHAGAAGGRDRRAGEPHRPDRQGRHGAPIDDSAAPIRDSRARSSGCVLVFRDVTTARRRAEADATAAGHLLEQTHDAICDRQHAGPILTGSQPRTSALITWVGKPYADWIGRPADEIIGPSHQRHHWARRRSSGCWPQFERVLRGEIVRYEEAVNFRGSGRRWINAILHATVDEADVADGLGRSRDRHHRAEAAGGGIAGRRPPQGRVPGDAGPRTPQPAGPDPQRPAGHAAGGRRPATAVEQARAMMERQLRQMVRLVDDLLDVSRITRGKLELRKERVELAAVVAQRRRDEPPAHRGRRATN